MTNQPCSKAVFKLIKITLLILLISSIKSEFKLQDLKQISDMILNYDKLPSSILKSTLKLSLVQFLTSGIDYIKNDQTIYQGSAKQTIDTLESYVKIFEFSDNSGVDKQYMKLINDYIKDILEVKETINLEQVSEDSKILLNKTQEFISDNSDKITEIIKDYNTIIQANTGTDTISSSSSSNTPASDSNINPLNHPDKHPTFPVLYIAGVCLVIMIVLCAVWYIFKRNRLERRNVEYMSQSDMI